MHPSHRLSARQSLTRRDSPPSGGHTTAALQDKAPARLVAIPMAITTAVPTASATAACTDPGAPAVASHSAPRVRAGHAVGGSALAVRALPQVNARWKALKDPGFEQALRAVLYQGPSSYPRQRHMLSALSHERLHLGGVGKALIKEYLEAVRSARKNEAFVNENEVHEIVATLVALRADVNASDRSYATTRDAPLVILADAGDAHLCELLIHAGAHQIDEALCRAIAKGHDDVINVLLRHARGHACNEAMVAALMQERYDIAHRLHRAGTSVDENGRRPTLVLASALGNLQRVYQMMQLGADLHITSDRHTPLTAACQAHAHWVVQGLVEAGADVHQKNPAGRTPLEVAIAAGHQDIVEYLTEHPAWEHHLQSDELDRALAAAKAAGDAWLVCQLQLRQAMLV